MEQGQSYLKPAMLAPGPVYLILSIDIFVGYGKCRGIEPSRPQSAGAINDLAVSWARRTPRGRCHAEIGPAGHNPKAKHKDCEATDQNPPSLPAGFSRWTDLYRRGRRTTSDFPTHTRLALFLVGMWLLVCSAMVWAPLFYITFISSHRAPSYPPTLPPTHQPPK